MTEDFQGNTNEVRTQPLTEAAPLVEPEVRASHAAYLLTEVEWYRLKHPVSFLSSVVVGCGASGLVLVIPDIVRQIPSLFAGGRLALGSGEIIAGLALIALSLVAKAVDLFIPSDTSQVKAAIDQHFQHKARRRWEKN